MATPADDFSKSPPSGCCTDFLCGFKKATGHIRQCALAPWIIWSTRYQPSVMPPHVDGPVENDKHVPVDCVIAQLH
jgi:hypothetical protein